MKRHLSKITIILLALLLIFGVSACTTQTPIETEETVIAIEIDSTTIPTNAIAGGLDLSAIKVKVYWSDETVTTLDLDLDMVSINDRAKLNKAGQQQLTVVYSGCTTKFQISFAEAPAQKYTLVVEGGQLIAINGITLTPDEIPPLVNGKFTAIYDADTKLTIRWISVDGYEFQHWTDNNNPVVLGQTTTVITMNTNHSYKAVTTALVSVVHFYTNGATVETLAPKRTNILNVSDINNGNVLIKEDHVFDGWTTTPVEGNAALNCTAPKIQFPYSVEVETSLYATWRKLGLTYAGDGQGGYIITKYNLDYLTDILKTPKVLEIPEKYQGGNVTGISANAFNSDEASMLETIIIPAKVSLIADGAFSFCTQLTKFILSSGNTSFKTDGNDVLYTNNEKKLIAYPAAKIRSEYTVLTACEEIAPHAFKDALIGRLILNSNLDKVGAGAFDSTHFDSINFSAVPFDGNSNFGDNMFCNNIRKILISSSYISNYKGSPKFSQVVSKLTTDIGEFKSLEEIIAVNASSNLLYRKIDNENAQNPRSGVEIIGVKRNANSVTVPITLEGRPVFSIAPRAFNYCVYLTNVIIPLESQLDRVCEDAFSDTPWLNTVKQNDSLIINTVLYKYLGSSANFVLPAPITRIAEGAFYGNDKLTSLNMTQNSKLTFIGAYAFYNCVNLTGSLDIMSNVETIFSYAFANTKITSLTLQDNSKLKTIGEKAFANCYYLTNAEIGGITSNIATNAFLYDYSLEKFSIQPPTGTAYFRVYNDILYKCNINGTANELFAYPAGKLMDVFDIDETKDQPNYNVVSIGDYALFYSNIAALKIPEKINSISAKSLYILGLYYVEFAKPLSNITFKLLFQDDPDQIGKNQADKKFEPDYIVFSIAEPLSGSEDDINISNFYAHNDTLRTNLTYYNASHTQFYYVDDLLLAYDANAIRLSVAKSSRTAIEFTIPSSYEPLSSFIKYIDEYAFFGCYVEKVTTGTQIWGIENYAFYGAKNFAVLDMKANTAIPLIAPNTFNSFFNNGLLVYILADSTQTYIERWTTNTGLAVSYKYLLESGEGIANYVTVSTEEWNTISYYEGGSWKVKASDTHTEQDEVLAGQHPIPSRNGYKFVGWRDESGNLIDKTKNYHIPYNINLTAVWQADVFTILLEVGQAQPITISQTYNTPFNYTAPTYPHKTFKYWKDSTGRTYNIAAGGNWDIVLFGTLVLYPEWEDILYIIDYDTDYFESYLVKDGEDYIPYANNTLENVQVKFGNNYNLVIPVKTGFIFQGWTLSEPQEGQIPVLITDNQGKSLVFWAIDNTTQYTVYPYFIAKSEITVTLMIDEGIQYEVVTGVVFGQSFTFEYLASKISDGGILSQYPVALFCGWVDSMGTKFTDDSGKGLYTWNVPADTTLYALWPQQINSQEEFNAYLASDNYLSKSIVLNCDVNLDKPIGEYNIATDKVSPYTGVFIGNGYTVHFNYTVESIESTNYYGYVGMIAYNKGTIKNVKLDAVIDIRTTSSFNKDLYLGGLAGVNEGRIISTSEDSSSDIVVDISVNFTNSSKYAYIGGIVGKNSGYINNISCEINTITISVSSVPYVGNAPNIIAGSIVGNMAEGSIKTRSAKYYYIDADAQDAYERLNDFGTYSAATQRVVNVTKIKLS